MKYFTKEWFDDTILAGMCFQVRKSAKAESFSEKYYLSLYKGQKKWFIKNEKYIAKHKRDYHTDCQKHVDSHICPFFYNEKPRYNKKRGKHARH